LFFWQILIFVGLIFLLKKFAWKPILDAVNDREQGIKDALLSAENARQEMQNLQADNQRILNEARAERDAMLKEAREMREKMIADSKNEAQAQGQKMIEQAKAAIESEKNAAMAELKSQVSTLSLSIAEKLLKEELSNKESQTKLVEKMLGDVKLN
jgi:F-type H+-transporting ATPase subunit b